MGAAKKRRLALIQDGHADVAKTVYATPQDLVQQTFLANRELDTAITERFEQQVKKDQCPTRADFLEKLVIAGLKSFDRFANKQEEPQESLISMQTTEQVVKLG